MPGRCPVDKQRNNHPFSEDFVRMVLSSCPSHIFPIKFKPVGVKCLPGMAGCSSQLFCTYSAACLAIGLVSQSTRIYWAFMWRTRQIHSLSSCSYVLRGLCHPHTISNCNFIFQSGLIYICMMKREDGTIGVVESSYYGTFQFP